MNSEQQDRLDKAYRTVTEAITELYQHATEERDPHKREVLLNLAQNVQGDLFQFTRTVHVELGRKIGPSPHRD